MEKASKTVYRPPKSQPSPVTKIHHTTLYSNLTRVAWIMGTMGIPYDVVQIIVGMLGEYKPRTVRFWRSPDICYADACGSGGDWGEDPTKNANEHILEWHEPTKKYWPTSYWHTCMLCNISTSVVICLRHGHPDSWDEDDMCDCYDLMYCMPCYLKEREIPPM